MFGEMLLTARVRDSTKQQEYLEIICSESERLSGLIENVLDFAALERGKRRYAMQNCDLSAIVAGAIETLHYRFEREGVEVSLHQAGGPARGVMDEQAMLLVVINLLDNAVKYGAGTPIEVTVETLTDRLEVRVRDHGPGIPQAEQKRVFERFYRTQKSRGSRGSGIGLAIVKRIAEEHHGRAWAVDAPDGGIVVGFSIPRRDPTAVQATHGGAPRHEGTSIDSQSATDIVARNG
jgi:two-component system phosphate regulon sensor histidine kinase PhoR